MKKDKKYLMGIDFGTLSARCVITDEVGCEVGVGTSDYPHGVMDKALPSGKALPPRFALQHPSDYLFSAKESISLALSDASLFAKDISGICIDFTGCTLLAVDERLEPLCLKDEFSDEPHAYVKLWKHYGAMDEVSLINDLAKERGERWLGNYGGTVLAEWMLPKILETANKAPKVFDATYRFVEAGDWLTWLITGEECHSLNFVGYKGLWNEETGYPSDEFFSALSPKLSGIVGTKISERISGTAALAGRINKKGSELLGLAEGTAVATPYLDAHAAMPALGLTEQGELMIIVGTSGVHIVNSEYKREFSGYLGCVKNSFIEGLYTYESAQAAVGDIFAWFVKNCVPESYKKEADELGIGIHMLLTEKAAELSVGESGLIALDFLNGNRSPLSDPALSGLMLGMDLGTRPEEMYRAWLEASAYGTRSIIEAYERGGIPIKRIVIGGGIARKNELFMQIYADVLGRKVEVSSSSQAGALGSAALASVAAGIYPDVRCATKVFAKPIVKAYEPIDKNAEMYAKLYNEYIILQKYFAGGANDVMKRLIEYKRKGRIEK